MRILTLEQFCQEPANTLFKLYQRNGEILSESALTIKADRLLTQDGDFTFSREKTFDPKFPDWRAKMSNGVEYESLTVCSDSDESDFEPSDLFLVYSQYEIIDMMRLLESCLKLIVIGDNGVW